MTITPEIAKLVKRLSEYHAEWAWAVGARANGDEEAGLDETSATAIKETLKELYWAMPRLCPYCGAEMVVSEIYPDQMGYSVAEYECPACGALVIVKHVPPEEE